MASKISQSLALILVLNLLFSSLDSAYGQCRRPPPPPQPTPPAGPVNPRTCSRDILKFGACANFLKGLTNVIFGIPPKEQCCSVMKGLVDLEAAVCLCLALKANIICFNVNIAIFHSLLLNNCGHNVPPGYRCV